MSLKKSDFPSPTEDLSYGDPPDGQRRRYRESDRRYFSLGTHRPLNADQDPYYYEPDMDA